MFPGVNGTTLAVTFAVFFLNLPFGFWRAGVRKFSLPWFLAVHAPIPLVVGLRLGFGLGWSFATFPLLASGFFAGQWLGGIVRQSWK